MAYLLSARPLRGGQRLLGRPLGRRLPHPDGEPAGPDRAHRPRDRHAGEGDRVPYFAGDPRPPRGPGHLWRRPVLALVFVAETGDISRFESARHLCSWAGITSHPRRIRREGPSGLHHPSRAAASCAGPPSRSSLTSTPPTPSGPTIGDWAGGGGNQIGRGRRGPQTSHPRLLRLATEEPSPGPTRGETRDGGNSLP